VPLTKEKPDRNHIAIDECVKIMAPMKAQNISAFDDAALRARQKVMKVFFPGYVVLDNKVLLELQYGPQVAHDKETKKTTEAYATSRSNAEPTAKSCFMCLKHASNTCMRRNQCKWWQTFSQP
jgi:hypothetical protein